MTQRLTAEQIESIRRIAQMADDVMVRARARLVLRSLDLADEAGDDGGGFRRQAWCQALPILRVAA